MGNGLLGIDDGMKGIAENIITSYDARVKALGDLVIDTRKTLTNFASDRKRMRREQANNLAGFVGDLSKGVGKMLKEFQSNHREMSDELKKDLDEYVGNIVKGTRKLLGEYHSDIMKARKIWEDMSFILAKSRKGGIMPRIQAGENVTTVGEAIKKRNRG